MHGLRLVPLAISPGSRQSKTQKQRTLPRLFIPKGANKNRCALAPPSPFSPPKPAPSHPHTRQGISPWGGKPGGLGLRAWRRLSAVGCCGTHPCGLSAAGASGWFRRACPLTRARCAPLPPALRADARLRRKMREHLSQMHELKRHPVAVSSGNLIRKGLKNG